MKMEEKLKKFSAELVKISPAKPQVGITPYRGETTVFSSKFGGVPYFPKNMEYPVVREGNLAGKPLRFPAQINFSEIPHMEGFPEKGILQFFAGCDGDDTYGADFDNGTDQNGFRIIYHGDIISDESQLIHETAVFEEDDYPFEGEFALRSSEVEQKLISFADSGFEKYAAAAYNKAFSTIFKKKKVRAFFGYTAKPCIDDDDPEFCEAMLGSGADEIMWGDGGVANFFISKEALAKLDFSRVLYNWDCF